MRNPHPDRIEGYRIESELARGGMGVVYLARQDFPDRRVALKLLSPELAADPDFRERFIRESNAAASTEHPNIVPIYGAGESGGRLYLAMRYVEGTDLGALIRLDGALDPKRAIGICSQVAAALDAAHARGLVHRDVKPGNVLIDAAGNAYLTDFGLITRNEIDTGLTKTGQFMGTTAYCAPEQIRGEEVDDRADVYSLGCVLFECLTGQAPFPRENEAATLYAHLEETPTKPSARRSGVPSGLDVVVHKAMAKRPDWRYASAGELASAARDAVGQPEAGPIGARPRRRLLWGGIGVAVLLASALVLALPLGGEPVMPPPEGGRALALRQGLLAIDPATRNVSKKIPGQIGVQIGAQTVRAPPTMAIGEGALWTTDLSGIVRVDATSGAITHIPSTCHDQVTVGLGAVWTACGGTVVRVDPFTFEQREIDLRTPVGVGSDPGTVRGLSLDRGTLWVSSDRDFFYRLDAIDAKVEYRIESVTADVFTVGEGALWAVDRVRSIVTPVTTRTGRPHGSIPIPGEVDAIAAGAGGVWLLDREGGTVTRIDPQTETVKASIGIGAGGNSITAAFDSVWITLPDDQDLVRIDPLTDGVERISIGAAATYAAPDPQTGWLWLIVIPPAGAGR